MIYGGPVKFAFTLLALILLIQFSTAAQKKTGSVCIAARIDDPFFKEPATLPNGEINSHGLKVRVDKMAAVDWPGRKGLKVSDLRTDEPHVLAVLSADGKPIQSVRFKFTQFNSTDLCMFYDGYQGIGLDDATRHTPWCKCR
jgi:hypothetical protein